MSPSTRAGVVHEAGDSALLLSLGDGIDRDVNARAVAIADAVRKAAVEGVRDVMPTYGSVAIFFNPLRTRLEDIHAALATAARAPVDFGVTRSHEIGVAYGGNDGPDLAHVARAAGLSEQEVVARHTGERYRVFMLGFMPGFPYLGTLDPAIATPRRASPRVQVPVGSVGIAGHQTGIYPLASPGGWQIIGRTDVTLFDTARTPAALCAPGDSLTFRAVTRVPARGASGHSGSPAVGRRTATILRAGLSTSIQDLGRWGYQHLGVPVSGSMDTVAHRVANLLVGNREEAATLEVTLLGPELRLDADTVLAVCGADLEASLDARMVPLDTPVSAPAGAVLRFGGRRAGARAYVAFNGGIASEPVLGSRATHAPAGLGGLGGRVLRAGDRIPLGAPEDSASGRATGLPRPPARGSRLRVTLGPQHRFCNAAAVDTLTQTRFTVSPQSSRIGYRLTAPVSLPPGEDGGMVSDATVIGGIQVTPSGQPIVLMADRPTCGGYPQIATVIAADLPRAAQLAPGDWVEFAFCSQREAIAALVAQEGAVLAVR